MTTHRTGREWMIDIRSWARDAETRMVDVIRAIELSVSVKVIMKSPVDTGRFRGNWYPSVGSPSATMSLEGFDKGGGTTIQRTRDFINGQTPFHAFYLTNNLPYAWPLEEGWSQQAPQGMVRTTIAEFNSVVRQETQRIRSRPRRR